MWSHISARIFAREGRPVVGVISQYRTFLLQVTSALHTSLYCHLEYLLIILMVSIGYCRYLGQPTWFKLWHPRARFIFQEDTRVSTGLKLPSRRHRRDAFVARIILPTHYWTVSIFH